MDETEFVSGASCRMLKTQGAMMETAIPSKTTSTISIDRVQFAAAIRVPAEVLPEHNSTGPYPRALLHCHEGNLYVECRNLILRVREWIAFDQVVGTEFYPFTLTLDTETCKSLSSWLEWSVGETVCVEFSPGRLSIEANANQVSFGCEAPMEPFGWHDNPPATDGMQIDSRALGKAIRQVAFAPMGVTGKLSEGFQFSADEPVLIAAGTDGNRLAVSRVPCAGKIPPVAIPARTAKAVVKYLCSGPVHFPSVSVRAERHQLILSAGRRVMDAWIDERKYPDWTAMLQSCGASKGTFRVDAKAFLAGLGQVTTFADANQVVSCQFTDYGRCHLRIQNSTTDSTVCVPGKSSDFSAKSHLLSIRPDDLKDGLRNVDGEVSMELAMPSTAQRFLLRVRQGDGFTMVVGQAG